MRVLPPQIVRLSMPVVAGAVLVCGSIACHSGSTVSGRLQDLLKKITDLGRPNASPDEIQQALTHQLRSAPVPAQGGNRPSSPAFPTRQTLQDFYASRGMRLAWCGDSGDLLPEAGHLLEALRRAGEHGLDPEEYALSRLDRMRDEMRAARRDEAAAKWADFDLLLTTAFFRYASDVSTGRVHPDEIRSDWLTQPPELHLPAALHKALREGHLEKLLETLPPPHPGYARLKKGLQELRGIVAAGGWPVIPDGPGLRVGSRGTRVAILRKRLSALAGARRPPTGGPADAVMDRGLAGEVERFQRLHGIEPDGIVSKSTLAELNVPVEHRVRQVELNLERWRWIPRRLGEPHVEVNIPGFELELVRQERAELQSRIVVGKAFTPTPVFGDRIVAVMANPSWNVPDELAVREYLPELREDPRAFRRHGIRIYESSDKDAREVDPASVHWRGMDDKEFHYHLRQDPGPDNALGRLKFHLTNDFQIYLHDTPARSLFARTGRDLSHGCIRVEKARELASRILGSSSGKLEEALDSEDEQTIPVNPPVPVQILYLTAWIDLDGSLRFGPDIYGFDAPQQEALDRVSRAPALPGGGAGTGARRP